MHANRNYGIPRSADRRYLLRTSSCQSTRAGAKRLHGEREFGRWFGEVTDEVMNGSDLERPVETGDGQQLKLRRLSSSSDFTSNDNAPPATPTRAVHDEVVVRWALHSSIILLRHGRISGERQILVNGEVRETMVAHGQRRHLPLYELSSKHTFCAAECACEIRVQCGAPGSWTYSLTADGVEVPSQPQAAK